MTAVSSGEFVEHTTVAALEEKAKLKKHFGRFDNKIPWGNKGAWICGVLCTAWSALATVALLYPGFGTSDPDSSLPDGWDGRRGSYEVSQFVPLAVLIAIGILFYALGAPTRAKVAEVKLAEIPDPPPAIA